MKWSEFNKNDGEDQFASRNTPEPKTGSDDAPVMTSDDDFSVPAFTVYIRVSEV